MTRQRVMKYLWTEENEGTGEQPTRYTWLRDEGSTQRHQLIYSCTAEQGKAGMWEQYQTPDHIIEVSQEVEGSRQRQWLYQGSYYWRLILSRRSLRWTWNIWSHYWVMQRRRAAARKGMARVGMVIAVQYYESRRIHTRLYKVAKGRYVIGWQNLMQSPHL